MKKLATLFLLLFAMRGLCQTMSYWASQFNKQGNAQYAQQYFATNGPGIAFSFDGVHWVISATGTNYVVATSTNATYAQYSTNWYGSNALYLLLSGQITNYTPGSNVSFTLTSPHSYRIDAAGGGGGGTNFYYTNSYYYTNVFVTNSFYTNYVTTNVFVTNLTIGLTTNFNVLFGDGSTNELNFTNGLLMAMNGAGPTHGYSIILPGGGYLLQPSGSTILLP